MRKEFKTLVDQGWTDAIRHLYPKEVVCTFLDYFSNAYNRNAGLLIDHFLLSPAIKKKLIAAGVDREVRGGKKQAIMRHMDNFKRLIQHE